MKKVKQEQQGSMLIETLISILLLAITMIAGIKLYFHADEIMALAVRKKVATEIVNAKLEEKKSQGFTAVTSEPLTAVTIGSLEAPVSDENGKYTGLKIEVDPQTIDGIDYKKVKVSLGWIEPDHQDTRTVEMTTLLML